MKITYRENERVDTIKELIQRSNHLYGNNIAYQYIDKDCIKDVTYKQLRDESIKVSQYLIANDLIGHPIAVIAPLSYEWMATYLGIVNCGGVAVLLDANLDEGELIEAIEKVETETVVYADCVSDKIESISHKNCKIQTAFGLGNKQISRINHCILYHNCINADLSNDLIIPEIDSDKLCTIVFTSGTTSGSKGVMLSHKNICASVLGGLSLVEFSSEDVSLSVLPINHMYELTCGNFILLYSGAKICINDELKNLRQNMIRFNPTVMFLVPLFLESFVKQIKHVAKNGQIPQFFGDKLKKLIVGGAPLDVETIIYVEKLGVKVLQGYGITECAPLISVNGDAYVKKESVGQVIQGGEAMVVDGEVYYKGDNVMQGYYKDTEATQAVFDGEWFKTGDIGTIDEDHFIYLSGRKKRLIITKNGENVQPEELENLIGRINYVEEVLVYTTGSSETITAEIYPRFQQIEQDHAETIYKQVIEEKIKEMNSTKQRYKQVGKIVYRDVPFEKTRTNKIKIYNAR